MLRDPNGPSFPPPPLYSKEVGGQACCRARQTLCVRPTLRVPDGAPEEWELHRAEMFVADDRRADRVAHRDGWMDEQQALLRAVLERPGDDAPRLVYADWLEEHGEPERAGFIRLQCEAARAEEVCTCVECVHRRGGGPHGHGRCDAEPLRRQADRLLAGRERDWFSLTGLPAAAGQSEPLRWLDWSDAAPVAEGTPRRGFVDSVTCTWERWLDLDRRMPRAQPLCTVRLTTIPDVYLMEHFQANCTSGEPRPGSGEPRFILRSRQSGFRSVAAPITLEAGDWGEETRQRTSLTGPAFVKAAAETIWPGLTFAVPGLSF